jgi:uncharacterized protein (TIGR04222 family)
MNPFDLRGPEFLVFFAVFAAALHLLWRPLVRAFTEPSGSAKPSPFNLSNLDPYLVAYLRGQENETARVAIVSLLDRGLLKVKGEYLSAVPNAFNSLHRPLERAVLTPFISPAKAASIFRDAGFRKACKGLRSELEKLGLIPDGTGRAWVVLVRLLLFGLLLGVGGVKVKVALARGHFNIVFVVILTAVAAIAMLKRKAPQRTRKGERALQDLRTSFARLEARADEIEPGGASRDLVLLAAIFGLAALPAFARAEATVLFPQGMKNQEAGGSCGSSCGSSSCGSSSCGGGGCGGGCGGCGG